MKNKIDTTPITLLQATFKQAPKLVANKALVFFKDSFNRQGWVNNGSLERWKPRSKGWGKKKRNHPILVLTGKLRRSIKITEANWQKVRIISDLPYSKIHNEGGKISQTIQIQAHSRTLKKSKKKGGSKTFQVKAHARKMNFTMPKRQFMGNSPDLIKSVEREIFNKLKQILK